METKALEDTIPEALRIEREPPPLFLKNSASLRRLAAVEPAVTDDLPDFRQHHVPNRLLLRDTLAQQCARNRRSWAEIEIVDLDLDLVFELLDEHGAPLARKFVGVPLTGEDQESHHREKLDRAGPYADIPFIVGVEILRRNHQADLGIRTINVPQLANGEKRVGLAWALQFQIAGFEKAVGRAGRFHHLVTDVSGGGTHRLVGRVGAGDEKDLVELKGLSSHFGAQKMAYVRGVELPSVEADAFWLHV